MRNKLLVVLALFFSLCVAKGDETEIYEGVITDDLSEDRFERHEEDGWQYAEYGDETVIILAAPTNLSGVVTIPTKIAGKNVAAIDDAAFAGRTGITSVFISRDYVWNHRGGIIGGLVMPWLWFPQDGVFYGCTGLKSVKVARGVSCLPNYMFAGCAALREVRFLGDKPTIVDSDTRELLLGTPESLVVYVDSKTLGWLEPINCGRIMRWQGRRVSYDNEPPFVRGELSRDEIEIAREELYGVANMLAAIGEIPVDMKSAYLAWAQGIVEEYPELIDVYSCIVQAVGEIPADVKNAILRWTSRVVTQGLTPPTESDTIGGGMSDATNVSAVSLTVTNVVVHYVVNSVQPEFAKPVSEDTGFVNVIAEVKGTSVAVPQTWAEEYPEFAAKFGSDFTKALTMKSGKTAAGGREMLVWEDYVAGTDPTDPNDKFTATMTMVDGKPVISWTPELDSERAAMRKYTTYGKAKLSDSEWTVVPDGREDDYNFFKVTVEMR